jgi:PAS domain S-box-containing protein
VDVSSNDFFSAVIDAAPDGLLIVDAQGEIVVANRQACELFGYAHPELIGRSVDDLLPDDVRRTHRAHRLRYRAEPEVRPMGVGLLLRARRGDASVFPVEVSLSPLELDGQLMVVTAVRDVSARIEAEDRMRRVLLALDATEDALFIVDVDTLRFEYVNEGAARQAHYRSDELVGMSFLHINPDIDEPGWRDVLAPLLADEVAAVTVRTTHRRRDGVDVPVELSLQLAAPGQDGKRTLIGVARDLTARLEAEAQKRRSEQALHDAEQVMAIADDRERIARDLHDTVIQRLFASGLALQALSARLEPEAKGRLETVVNDLDETIRDIRTTIFSLQASGPVESGLRGRILDLVHQAADSLGFEPRTQFDGPVETIDPEIADELLPTLREALSNVARHAAARHVRVIVEVGPAISLSVVDDGVGAPAEVIGGKGVANMRTRAARLGGSCAVEQAEPSGTRLVWRVPRDAPAPASTG